MYKLLITLIACAASALSPSAAMAFGISHHGGIILDCEAPIFFDESPAKDAKVPSFQKFSVIASENTDPETVKVWVNNQPIAVQITAQRSGRLLIEGSLPAALSSGKAWVKTTAISHDGCDQLHNWNVYIGN
jgi:hypothetical protein